MSAAGWAQVGLDRVGEGVHARVGGDLGWNGHRKGGVGVSSIGEKIRADDTFLELVALVEQDGVGRNLAACTRGGGHACQPEALLFNEAGAEAVGCLLVAVGEGGDELGCVEHRAAADAEHAVGAEFADKGEHLLEIGECGFRRDVLKKLHLDAVVAQLRESAFYLGDDGARGKHEQTLVAQREIVFNEILYAACSEHDLGGLQ